MVQQPQNDKPVTYLYLDDVNQEIALIFHILPLILEEKNTNKHWKIFLIHVYYRNRRIRIRSTIEQGNSDW